MRLALRAGRARARHHPPQPGGGRGGGARGAGWSARGYHQPRRRPPRRDRRRWTRCGRRRARGATLYVTLEPCCHTGRTGPCTERLLARRASRRVVVGCLRREPAGGGQGHPPPAARRRAGRRRLPGDGVPGRQPRPSSAGSRERRPLVTLKAAATLDGFIAPRRAGPAPAAPLDHRHPRRARRPTRCAPSTTPSWSGAGTVLADDPRLTVRPARARPGPPAAAGGAGRAACARRPPPGCSRERAAAARW